VNITAIEFFGKFQRHGFMVLNCHYKMPVSTDFRPISTLPTSIIHLPAATYEGASFKMPIQYRQKRHGA